MPEVVSYKDQLENFLHIIRSPIVVLSLASESLIALYKDKNITISASKVDEYTESLNLIQSSIKRLNDALREAQENMLIVNQEGV